MWDVAWITAVACLQGGGTLQIAAGADYLEKFSFFF